MSSFIYDAAGDVIQDGVNNYLYDPEGRVCASETLLTSSATMYLYDAEGVRVAKGGLTGISWPSAGHTWTAGAVPTCPAPTSANGFSIAEEYLHDFAGDQMTELVAPGTPNAPTGCQAPVCWEHTNVFAAGHLDATYDTKGLHFHFADPLGSRRVQMGATGLVEATFQSLPYGNGFVAWENPNVSTADDATEHHFTGKERDTESGNDYFGARYYASTMGRFLSPDPKQITKQRIADPQQWNMYAYTRNNPLVAIDPDGKELRFINQEQANRALREFRAAVTPAQRSAISLGTKDGHIVMQVDPAAAKAAGDSNLGRLGFVTSSDKVAQFEYKSGGDPIAFTGNGKSGSTTFTDMMMKGDAAGGITLPNSDAKGYMESPDPSKTEVIMNTDYQNGASLAESAADDSHEVMAHVYEFFKTGDITQSDDKALRNTDIPKVMGEAEINARQPDVKPNQQ